MEILEAYKESARGAVRMNNTAAQLTAMAYRYHRRAGKPATAAMELAKADAANGKTRYASSLAGGWNPAFAAFGESQMRWIENPERCGLRFVGYADECAGCSVNHTGWYLDGDFGETVRGIVYQMPARNGAPVFVAGYADPFNGRKNCESTNPACLSFSSVVYGESGYFSTDPRDNPECADAGRLADRITEIMAESEREYREVSDARHRFESLGDEIAETRRAALALIRDIKGLCPTLADFSAASAALRSRLESMLDDIRDNRETRAALASDYSHHDGWNDY